MKKKKKKGKMNENVWNVKEIVRMNEDVIDI